MRGIPVPDREEDFTADPVELFFDLAYVFAFSRLVWLLVHDPTWEGIGEFALLFTMIWLPWTQFTWSANAVAGNTRTARLLFLVATVVSVPMAASVTAAFDDGGAVFAISAALILSMGLFTLLFGADTDAELRSSLVRYSVPNFIAIVMMVVGGYLDREPRTVVWIVALVVVVIGTVRAGHSEWLVRPGHFAERHGLILIVALGEVIVALGVPVVDTLDEGGGLPATTLASIVATGVFACVMWWAYFDRPSPAMEHHHESIDAEGVGRGRFARDVYTYSHVPLVAGVILAAAALEDLALHPSDPAPTAFRWMLFGGLALYLLGVVVAIYRTFRIIAIERLIATGALAVLIGASSDVDGLWLVIAVDVVLLVTLALEHVRVEVHPRALQGSDSGA